MHGCMSQSPGTHTEQRHKIVSAESDDLTRMRLFLHHHEY